MSDLYGDLSLRVTTEVHIRPARADDLGLLSRWNSSVDRVIVPTLQRQASGQALVLVAMLGPWPVGHLLVDFTRLADSAASYLWHMGVHDTFRNHGIGSGLISMAESEGRTRGLSFAQLEVGKSNRDALRLYEQLGYLIVGEEDSVWSEPDENGRPHDVSHPCWVMRKPLSTEAAVPRLSRWAVSPGWCPRPRPTSSLLQAVRDHYAIDALGEPVDLGGSSNLSLRLTGAGGGAYVLRVHRAWVTAERLDAVNKVRRHLIGRGLPFVGAVPTRAGVYWIRVGEHLVELEPYVEGQDMDRSETLLTGMRMLARVHAELRGVSAKGAAVAPVANHIGAEVARIFARRGAAIIRSWAMDPSDGGLADSLERVAEELWEAERPYVQYLSPQLVHGDFWDNNVLFRSGRVAAILDLDFMEERPRIDDLALILYYAYPTARAVSDGQEPIESLARLVQAYASAADPPMTQHERLDLPFAVARTCLHFTRHLALRVRDREQRDVMNANREEVEWGQAMVPNARRWQEAFAQ